MKDWNDILHVGLAIDDKALFLSHTLFLDSFEGESFIVVIPAGAFTKPDVLTPDYSPWQADYDVGPTAYDAMPEDWKELFFGAYREPLPVPELARIDIFSPVIHESYYDYTEKQVPPVDRTGAATASMYRRGKLSRVLGNQHGTRPFAKQGRRRVLYGV